MAGRGRLEPALQDDPQPYAEDSSWAKMSSASNATPRRRNPSVGRGRSPSGKMFCVPVMDSLKQAPRAVRQGNGRAVGGTVESAGSCHLSAACGRGQSRCDLFMRY